MTTDTDLATRLEALEQAERARALDAHGMPITTPLPIVAPKLSDMTRNKLDADKRRWQEDQDRREAQAEAERQAAESERRFWLDPDQLAAALVQVDADLVGAEGDLCRAAVEPPGSGKEAVDARRRNADVAEAKRSNLLARRERIADTLAAIRRREANAPLIASLEAEADEVRARLQPLYDEARPFEDRLAEIDTEIRRLSE
ncbi:MAG: hypothetical protein ACLQPH_20305 [Acidimicrobiales bacterium]